MMVMCDAVVLQGIIGYARRSSELSNAPLYVKQDSYDVEIKLSKVYARRSSELSNAPLYVKQDSYDVEIKLSKV
jgi:hypothetical protein